MEKDIEKLEKTEQDMVAEKRERLKKAEESVRSFIKNETILKAKVFSAGADEEKGDYVTLFYDNREFVIYAKDLDYEMNVTGVLNFIDRPIYFIATDYEPETGRVVASRAIAQQKFKDKIIATAGEDKIYKGMVSVLLPFGAYIELEGGVTGLLKNKDFTEDHICVEDVYSPGDTFDVKILKIYADNKIALTVPQKYKKINMPDLERYKEGSVVSGNVVSVKDFGFFVRILPAVDILCPLPPDEEILVGSKVLVKLKEKNVKNDVLQLNGKWVRTIHRVNG